MSYRFMISPLINRPVSDDWRARLLLIGLTAIAAVVFCLGITWGLPSRDIDPYLFGDEPVWPGEKIKALAGDRPNDPTRGADVDVNPLAARDRIICVNETDQQRAQIIRRYRLFTYQPDEVVTMMALARMRPGQLDLDPRLYQYGGLWIYPIGALLRAASAAGLVTLTADEAYYLDHPEAFGRFYVVARLYGVAWGLVGVWAVLAIVRRLTGGCLTSAAAAAACYIAMPVVITMTHEAKPHLPGAVLMLLAVLAALRYVESASRRAWFATACLCGAAFGMVLAAWPVFAVLPVMMLLRPHPWRQRVSGTLIGLLIAAAVYFATNPYVLINLLTNREVIRSNLMNTREMFHVGPIGDALGNAVFLIREGASLILAAVGGLGALALGVTSLRRPTSQISGLRGAGWLLATPALLLTVQFVAFAAGQPGEYARFALFIDVCLAVAAACAARRVLRDGWPRWSALSLLLLTAVPCGCAYQRAFMADRDLETSRTRAADRIEFYKGNGLRTLAVSREPAPYAVPPVNVFHWRVLLLPSEQSIVDAGIDAAFRAVDVPRIPAEWRATGYWWGPRKRIVLLGETEMCWAAKPFIWLVREYSPVSTREATSPAP